MWFQLWNSKNPAQSVCPSPPVSLPSSTTEHLPCTFTWQCISHPLRYTFKQKKSVSFEMVFPERREGSCEPKQIKEQWKRSHCIYRAYCLSRAEGNLLSWVGLHLPWHNSKRQGKAVPLYTATLGEINWVPKMRQASPAYFGRLNQHQLYNRSRRS